MNFIKGNLLIKVFIGIVLGILAGLPFVYETGAPKLVVEIVVTFMKLFGNFLGFIIPLIILGLVAPAIAELGRGAGKWLLITAGIAYGSTIFAGLLSFTTGKLLFPAILHSESKSTKISEPGSFDAIFTVDMPPLMGVMTALLLAFVLGVGMTMVRSDAILRGFREFRNLVMVIIEKAIIPLLPYYIFSIFMNMTAEGTVASVIWAVAKIILVVFVLTVFVLLLQYLIAGTYAGTNPVRAFLTMLPAYATALGTSSSAATIPVTLECTKKNGVTDAVASFVVPLCATIHLAGSTLKIVAFSMTVMIMSGMPLDSGKLIGFIFMLGVTMVAAPGVPGGAIVAASGLLTQMLGFNDQMVGFMVATYIAIDSFGTATNVTGDGAIALIVNKMTRGHLGEQAPAVAPKAHTL